jgi:hypothetical protein
MWGYLASPLLLPVTGEALARLQTSLPALLSSLLRALPAEGQALVAVETLFAPNATEFLEVAFFLWCHQTPHTSKAA